jgi:hypothetical protein
MSDPPNSRPHHRPQKADPSQSLGMTLLLGAEIDYLNGDYHNSDYHNSDYLGSP